MLTLCLVLGLFPIGVLAAPVDPGDVEATKTATYDPETDEVTITLSVQGKDVTETVTEENPVDVVLVVDNSGSMDDNGLPCSSSTFKKHTFGLLHGGHVKSAAIGIGKHPPNAVVRLLIFPQLKSRPIC